MSFKIRPAKPEDAKDAARVVKAVYDELGWEWDPEEYHADLYDLQIHYFDHGDSFWLAEWNGEVVGTVALARFPTVPEGETPLVQLNGKWRISGTDCSLERLYLVREARGLGIGRALFELTLQTAREEGRVAMEIWSDKSLHDAHRMYQRAGAVIVGDRLCHDPSNAPEWGMLLDLTP